MFRLVGSLDGLVWPGRSPCGATGTVACTPWVDHAPDVNLFTERDGREPGLCHMARSHVTSDGVRSTRSATGATIASVSRLSKTSSEIRSLTPASSIFVPESSGQSAHLIYPT